MKYSIQCIASSLETDKMLEQIECLHQYNNRYELHDKSFHLFTYLSKAKVQAKLYLFSYHELSFHKITKVTVPSLIVIVDIPNEPSTYETLLQWATFCNRYEIQYLFRNKEVDYRDEMFVMVFTQLLYQIDSTYQQLKQKYEFDKEDTSKLNLVAYYHGHAFHKLYQTYQHCLTKIWSKDKEVREVWLKKSNYAFERLYRPLLE